jgi:hypothetical protein
MHTDRPDTTESPRTVPRGRVQLEISAFEWSRDKHAAGPDSTDTRRIAIAPLNLKLGITDSIDVQLVLEPWTRVRAGDDDQSSGFGDLTLRTKVNFWGNDEGSTALGIMPFITFPTGADGLSSEAIEGGLILPFAIDLDDKTGLGFMAELDLVHDPDNDRYEAEFLHTAVLSRDLWGGLAGFLEYAGLASLHGRDYIATANTGLTYELTPDLVLDGGVRIGLTSAADDVEIFTGVSLRF